MNPKTRRAQIVGATLLGGLHFFVVGTVLIKSGASGESQGFFILFVDLPLVFLLSWLPGGQYLLDGSRLSYILVTMVVGTSMYAAIGWLIGRWLGRDMAA